MEDRTRERARRRDRWLEGGLEPSREVERDSRAFQIFDWRRLARVPRASSQTMAAVPGREDEAQLEARRSFGDAASGADDDYDAEASAATVIDRALQSATVAEAFPMLAMDGSGAAPPVSVLQTNALHLSVRNVGSWVLRHHGEGDGDGDGEVGQTVVHRQLGRDLTDSATTVHLSTDVSTLLQLGEWNHIARRGLVVGAALHFRES